MYDTMGSKMTRVKKKLHRPKLLWYVKFILDHNNRCKWCSFFLMSPLVNGDASMTLDNITWVEPPWPIVACDFDKSGASKNMHATQA